MDRISCGRPRWSRLPGTLLQVSIDDAAEAERVVSDLMGDQVEPRKEFIQKHARDVRFLDI